MDAHPLHGVWAAALTPLTDDLAPDPARGAQHAERLLGAGCHGIVVFGTTGEAPSFSVAERVAYLDGLIAAGIDPGRLIVGTGCPALPDTIALTRHAAATGATGVLTLPPYFYKNPGEAGLHAAFSRVLAAAGTGATPLLLYNIPQQSGITVPPALLSQLIAEFGDAVGGVKDSSGDPGSLAAYLAAGTGIFAGTEDLLLGFLGNGLAGCITATGNVNTHGIRALYDAGRVGDPTADELQTRATAVRTAFAGTSMIPALKTVIAHLYRDPGWLRTRPPFVPDHAPDAAHVLDRLERAGWQHLG
jgi:4-hydroxy-tetrahydrodipicolinate synthase